MPNSIGIPNKIATQFVDKNNTPLAIIAIRIIAVIIRLIGIFHYPLD
jgi:hypothetical protein